MYSSELSIVRPPCSTTETKVFPRTTCALVTTTPLLEMKNPLPHPSEVDTTTMAGTACLTTSSFPNDEVSAVKEDEIVVAFPDGGADSGFQKKLFTGGSRILKLVDVTR